MANIFIIGPAGSGKSTISYSLNRWMLQSGQQVNLINLDPGAESIPYAADYDIREIVTVREIMLSEGLGPNGALIRAAEIIEDNLEAAIGKIGRLNGDYKIIDTPGQMEIFLFREFGPKLIAGLKGRNASVFTIDPGLLAGPIDLVVLKLLGLVVELRLGVPALEVLNKSDLYKEDMLMSLQLDLMDSRVPHGGISDELASDLFRVVGGLEKKKRVIAVSAKEGRGMDQIYKALGELFCSCGDLS